MGASDGGGRERKLQRIVDTLGLAQTVQPAHASLRPTSPRTTSLVLEALPELSIVDGARSQRESAELAALPASQPQLELRGVLGEGGMGVVRMAVQTPLRREVAVKSARAGSGVVEASLALVQEAIITGQLEHPNVVPVHLLGRDGGGVPLLVMKRIEGTLWGDLLRDRQHPHWARVGVAERDQLEWNLGVLMQVAQAIHFAHSRGYIHRDIKPGNVMIGGFGEVYVLDWGLAIPRDRVPAAPPAADEVPSIVGTPAYMPPEMALGEHHRLSERTDVYLLGAVLHEILAGQAPHPGNIAQALLSALVSAPPSYGPEVPGELGEIARRAMSARPDDRFASGEELRLALAAFVRNRSALALCDRAVLRFDDLSRALGEKSPDPIALYRIFGECRFGFQEALRSSPDSAGAREGLRRCVLRMAEHELERRNPEAAAAVLADLADPPAELVQRIAALQAQLTAEAGELEKLRAVERDLDVRAGDRERVGAVAVGGVALGAVVITTLLLRRQGTTLTLADPLWIAALVLLVILAGGLLGRHRLFPNQASRRLGLGLVIGVTAVLLHRLLAQLTQPAMWRLLGDDLLLLATSAATGAAILDRRLIGGAIWLTASAVVMAILRGPALPIFAAGALGAIAIVLLSWRRGGRSEHPGG